MGFSMKILPRSSQSCLATTSNAVKKRGVDKTLIISAYVPAGCGTEKNKAHSSTMMT